MTLKKITLFSLAFVVVMVQVIPATAIMTLTGVSYAPNLPLLIGMQQHVTAKYYVGPSGATTFIPGHQLQMQTELVNAQWNIQVLVDGRNAARQSASGSTVFVNGALLSYSTNQDVSLDITIGGVVPQEQAYQMMVLLVKEIDNSGSVVPGSTILISQPVAGQPATTTQTVPPIPAPTIILPSPTTSAGFPVTTGIFAIGLLYLLLFRCGR
jgi:hypothetical protein